MYPWIWTSAARRWRDSILITLYGVEYLRNYYDEEELPGLQYLKCQDDGSVVIRSRYTDEDYADQVLGKGRMVGEGIIDWFAVIKDSYFAQIRNNYFGDMANNVLRKVHTE
jgi:hypothetical protein